MTDNSLIGYTSEVVKFVQIFLFACLKVLCINYQTRKVLISIFIVDLWQYLNKYNQNIFWYYFQTLYSVIIHFFCYWNFT